MNILHAVSWLLLALMALPMGAVSSAQTTRPTEGQPRGLFNAPEKQERKPRHGGIAARPVKIVFVCDASESTGRKFEAIQAELRQVVDKLRPSHEFNIIFFHSGQARALNPGALVTASDENKDRARAFVDAMEVSPNSNPLPALKLAFSLRPDLVYFLTDANFEFAPDAPRQVTDSLQALNKDRQVKVNAILLVSGEGLDESIMPHSELMKQIARDHGGVFKIASAHTLVAPTSAPTTAPALGPATAPAAADAVKTRYKRIAFVYDGSASMGSKFNIAKDQLKMTIQSLEPGQQFNVVFFQKNRAVPFNRTSLVPATDAWKSRATKFLDLVNLEPDSDPIAALELAFKQRPEVIFLATDGEFEFAANAPQLVKTRVEKLNVRRTIRLNTVTWGHPDNPGPDTGREAGFRRYLEELAVANRGQLIVMSLRSDDVLPMDLPSRPEPSAEQ